MVKVVTTVLKCWTVHEHLMLPLEFFAVFTSLQLGPASYIESLKRTLTDIQKLNTNPEVSEKLGNALDLVRTLDTIEKGILRKFRLDGQVALVTGGGQGIGRSLAIGLGEAGCKVAIADMQFEKAESVVAELRAKGIDGMAIKVDVSKKEEVQSMVDAVVAKFGDLHIACNNAGIVFHSPSEDTSESEWRKTMAVNLDGVFYCCQAEAQHMLKKNYGKIINTASMSGTIVNQPQKQVAYNVSKAGVVHLTKTLGSEWCSRGVTVNCISPGYVETVLNQTEALMTVREKWLENTPMKRLADVEDLVGAVLYLASPLSNFTTGCDLIIDGGFTCW